jgi:hypothetical protein
MYDVNNPHPGRETGQMPFLRPSLFQMMPKIDAEIKNFNASFGENNGET